MDNKKKVSSALKKWRELRDMFDPEIALHFPSPESFREALEIAFQERIHYEFPGRTDLIVPPALVCLFEHLDPDHVPVVPMSSLPVEEQARIRGQKDFPRQPSFEEKKARIAELKGNLGI